MILSKTTTYAIRILAYMAKNRSEVVNSVILHEKLSIPIKYLQRLLTDLSKAGFITGTRGRTGGFVFARNPELVKISEIVDAIDDMGNFDICILGVKNCDMVEKCALHESWVISRNMIVKNLTERTLVGFTEVRESEN